MGRPIERDAPAPAPPPEVARGVERVDERPAASAPRALAPRALALGDAGAAQLNAGFDEAAARAPAALTPPRGGARADGRDR